MPISVLLALKKLRGDGKSVCTREEFRRVIAEFGLGSSPAAISYLFRILSGLGALRWFPHVDDSLVILNTQWLLDSMACIIREHDGEHSQLLQHLKQDTRAILLFKEEQVKRGIFPVALLRYIWSSKDVEYKALNGRPQEIQALERILENSGLICRVQMPTGKSGAAEEFYVVPALLPKAPAGTRFDTRIRRRLETYPDAQQCTCKWDFGANKWLPEYVFERLMCEIVKSCGVVRLGEVVLKRGVADIRAGDAVLLLRLHQERLCIEAQTVNYVHCPHAARLMLNMVQEGLNKVMQRFSRKTYKVMLQTPTGEVE